MSWARVQKKKRCDTKPPTTANSRHQKRNVWRLSNRNRALLYSSANNGIVLYTLIPFSIPAADFHPKDMFSSRFLPTPGAPTLFNCIEHWHRKILATFQLFFSSLLFFHFPVEHVLRPIEYTSTSGDVRKSITSNSILTYIVPTCTPFVCEHFTCNKDVHLSHDHENSYR